MVAAAVIGAVFIISGIFLIIHSARLWMIIKKYRAVEAVLTDHVEKEMKIRQQRVRNVTAYSPVYEYFDEETKQYTSRSYSTERKPVGTKITLYISENGRIYEKSGIAAAVICGIVFMAVGMLFAAPVLISKPL